MVGSAGQATAVWESPVKKDESEVGIEEEREDLSCQVSDSYEFFFFVFNF